MRVAVVFFSGRNREKIRDLANGLARGIGKQGNQVDVFDGGRDTNVKLTIYQYIVIGMEPSGSFSGKGAGFGAGFPCRLRSGLGKKELCLRVQVHFWNSQVAHQPDAQHGR